uniref:Uncharacterized protein n=2 Tax=Parascaris TaxID=6254 RepID=A0A914RH35_PAREQ
WNIYAYINLYDAFKLYAIAARRLIHETGKIESVMDGKMLWSRMRRMIFPGFIGF